LDGVFAIAFFMLVLFFVGINTDLTVAIILASLAPLAGGVLGLINLGYGAIITIFLFGGLVIYKLKA